MKVSGAYLVHILLSSLLEFALYYLDMPGVCKIYTHPPSDTNPIICLSILEGSVSLSYVSGPDYVEVHQTEKQEKS